MRHPYLYSLRSVLRRPAEQYALIDSMRKNYTIIELCDALEVSPSGYHAANKRPESQRTTENALRTGYITDGAIFHSDRGCQYTASSTRDLLHKHDLRQSMSAAGYCYDNAFAESAFASLKTELPGAGQPFPSKQAARLAIFDYIETFYNRRRRHTSLGSISAFDDLKINFTTQNKNLNTTS